eukprot:1192288-Prorocentrum_minimum.AAC.3
MDGGLTACCLGGGVSEVLRVRPCRYWHRRTLPKSGFRGIRIGDSYHAVWFVPQGGRAGVPRCVGGGGVGVSAGDAAEQELHYESHLHEYAGGAVGDPRPALQDPRVRQG